jgi:hypothetical protein
VPKEGRILWTGPCPVKRNSGIFCAPAKRLAEALRCSKIARQTWPLVIGVRVGYGVSDVAF